MAKKRTYATINGWTIIPVLNWWIAKKPGFEPIWFHDREFEVSITQLAGPIYA